MGKFCTLTVIFACLFVCEQVCGEEEKWSGCWTQFPALDTICKSEYGPEYEGTTSKSCGTFSLGKMALCKQSYPGCKSTVCYSAFVSAEDTCNNEFGSSLPIANGSFSDCAPGFRSIRCCPN